MHRHRLRLSQQGWVVRRRLYILRRVREEAQGPGLGESHLRIRSPGGMKSALGHYKARFCILYFQSYSATYGPPDRLVQAVERATVEAGSICPGLSGYRSEPGQDLVSPWAVDYLSSLCRPDFQVWA